MLKDLQRMLAKKQQELNSITKEIKALKGTIALLQKEGMTKEQNTHKNYKQNVAIGYDLPTNSIYVKVFNSEHTEHLCYLDSVDKIVEKAMSKFPNDKYSLVVMEHSFEQGLNVEYSQKLIQAIRLTKKSK